MNPDSRHDALGEPGRCRILAALALGTLAFGLFDSRPAAADPTQAPSFGEVIQVPLVEVELLATDRDGRPVDDLALGDLRLFEDDVEVTPASFQRLAASRKPSSSAAAKPGAAGAPVVATPDRYVAVFLDDVHVSAAGRHRLLTDLAGSLEANLAPQDRVMVAIYDGVTRVALPFTRDRKLLRRTLENAESLSTARLVVEQEIDQALELVHRDASGESGTSPCLHAQEIVDHWLAQENDRVDRAIRSFRTFVDSLAGIEGKKTVFHVSDGIPLRPGAEASEYAQELCSGTGVAEGQNGADLAMARDIYDPGNRTLEDTRFDTSLRWRDLAARANAGNVTIYAFQADLGRTRFPGSADQRYVAGLPGARSRAVANLQEPLHLMSDGTGGRAFYDGGDQRGAVDAAVGELDGQYLLTYTPPQNPDAGVRNIRIESSRAGLELRYRKLYRPLSLDDQIGNQLMGRLLYGESGASGTSGLRLELGRIERTGDEMVRARFRLGLPIAGLGLAEKERFKEGSFTAFVSVAAEDGGTTSVRKAVVPVRIAADAAKPVAGGEQFVWEVEIVLRPGKQRLGIAVHDELVGTTNFVVRSFDVDLPRS